MHEINEDLFQVCLNKIWGNQGYEVENVFQSYNETNLCLDWKKIIFRVKILNIWSTENKN